MIVSISVGHSLQPEINQLLFLSGNKSPQWVGFEPVCPVFQTVCVTTELTHTAWKARRINLICFLIIRYGPLRVRVTTDGQKCCII